MDATLRRPDRLLRWHAAVPILTVPAGLAAVSALDTVDSRFAAAAFFMLPAVYIAGAAWRCVRLTAIVQRRTGGPASTGRLLSCQFGGLLDAAFQFTVTLMLLIPRDVVFESSFEGPYPAEVAGEGERVALVAVAAVLATLYAACVSGAVAED